MAEGRRQRARISDTRRTTKRRRSNVRSENDAQSSTPAVGALQHLPTEILLVIFRHFESRELAGLHAVCRRFNNVLHQAPELWREASFYKTGDVSVTMPLMLKGIKELRKRGGRIEDLSICFERVYPRAFKAKTVFRNIMKTLPTLGLREIWIHFDATSLDGIRDTPALTFFNAKGYMSMHSLMAEALARCDTLESVTVCSELVSNDFFPPLGRTVPTQLSLDILMCLQIQGASAWNCLVPVLEAISLPSLGFLKLEKIDFAAQEDLLTLLHKVKHTLTELMVEIRTLIDVADCARDVVLARVDTLEWEVESVEHEHYRLHAPVLRNLWLHFCHESMETEHLLGPSLVDIALDDMFPFELLDFRSCEGLESVLLFMILDDHPAEDALVNMFPAHYNIPFDDLEVTQPGVGLQSYVNLVQARSVYMHRGVRKPIRRLVIRTHRAIEDANQEHVQYLSENVANFQLLLDDIQADSLLNDESM